MRAPPAAADPLEGAARHLLYALEQSSTMEEAFQKLRSAANPRQLACLDELQHLLQAAASDDGSPQSMRLSSFPSLAWLLRQSGPTAKSAAAVFREFRSHESFQAASIGPVWSEINNSLGYLGAVLAILIVIISVYAIFVLPQFRVLYTGFGRNLPTPTGFLFGEGSSASIVLVLIAVGLLGFTGRYVYLLRRQLRRYVPLPGRYQRIPLAGPVTLAYHEYLWLSYAGLLRAAGMPAEAALRLAATRVPLASATRWELPDASETKSHSGASDLMSDLSVAARLGKLDEEALFQQQASADRFVEALDRSQRRARVILIACIYLLVAAFVSAMYLPIFSLGSAI